LVGVGSSTEPALATGADVRLDGRSIDEGDTVQVDAANSASSVRR